MTDTPGVVVFQGGDKKQKGEKKYKDQGSTGATAGSSMGASSALVEYLRSVGALGTINTPPVANITSPLTIGEASRNRKTATAIQQQVEGKLNKPRVIGVPGGWNVQTQGKPNTEKIAGGPAQTPLTPITPTVQNVYNEEAPGTLIRMGNVFKPSFTSDIRGDMMRRQGNRFYPNNIPYASGGILTQDQYQKIIDAWIAYYNQQNGQGDGGGGGEGNGYGYGYGYGYGSGSRKKAKTPANYIFGMTNWSFF